MNCDACRSKFLEYLDRELTGTAGAELEAHLGHCPGCREELRALQDTISLVGRMPTPEPSEAFWQQYLRELRQKVEVSERRPRLWSWLTSLPLRPVPALAAATAVIVVIFATLTMRPEQPPMPQLSTLAVTQQLALSQELDLLREMDLLEEMELLEDWELIQVFEVPPRAT